MYSERKRRAGQSDFAPSGLSPLSAEQRASYRADLHLITAGKPDWKLEEDMRGITGKLCRDAHYQHWPSAKLLLTLLECTRVGSQGDYVYRDSPWGDFNDQEEFCTTIKDLESACVDCVGKYNRCTPAQIRTGLRVLEKYGIITRRRGRFHGGTKAGLHIKLNPDILAEPQNFKGRPLAR